MRDAAVVGRSSPDMHRRRALTAFAIALTAIYLVLSLPVLRTAVEEQPELALFLIGGMVSAVGAAKVPGTGWKVVSGVVAAYLLIVGSGGAWFIWLHGITLFGLVVLVMVVARASDPFARAVGVVSLAVVGTLGLAYGGILLVVVFGCAGEGCFY